MRHHTEIPTAAVYIAAVSWDHSSLIYVKLPVSKVTYICKVKHQNISQGLSPGPLGAWSFSQYLNCLIFLCSSTFTETQSFFFFIYRRQMLYRVHILLWNLLLYREAKRINCPQNGSLKDWPDPCQEGAASHASPSFPGGDVALSPRAGLVIPSPHGICCLSSWGSSQPSLRLFQVQQHQWVWYHKNLKLWLTTRYPTDFVWRSIDASCICLLKTAEGSVPLCLPCRGECCDSRLAEKGTKWKWKIEGGPEVTSIQRKYKTQQYIHL